VEGDINHQSLAIEQGAFFEGKSRRSDDPLSDAKSGMTGKTGFGKSASSSSTAGTSSTDGGDKSPRAAE